ncbi:transcriptional regulator [Alteribacter lacisalsi]|uniref:Transcriptional regulator n=1 Tax=Alteribacter lacisalsi TaxID=2045244 RepID=A0A2W0HJ94_9BACI|nr:helix-turn-helix domain-containing protein [Alteribacter lacisalsi]PYZ97082.1 transcriptional regulator [Alteribacter lacisalsi]
MRNWLTALRLDRKLTQEDVAGRAFINRSYYAQIEKGSRNPSIRVAGHIARVLGFNPSAFFMEDFDDPFMSTLSSAPVILSHCDLELRYTWLYNPHPDFSENEWLGKRADELTCHPGGQKLTELKKEVIETGLMKRCVICYPLSSGEAYFDVHAQPLRVRDGSIIGAATMSTDLTYYFKETKNLYIKEEPVIDEC